MELTRLPLCVVLFVVLIAAGLDLWNFRIHNALTIPFCLVGLLYHFLVAGPSGLVGGILGVGVANLPFIPLYRSGGMGAGDMKLMAVVGAWLGPWAMLHVIIVSGLATGCYSVGLVLWNHFRLVAEPGPPLGHGGLEPDFDFHKVAKNVMEVLHRPHRRSHVVPYGVMVALGVIVTAFWIG